MVLVVNLHHPRQGTCVCVCVCAMSNPNENNAPLETPLTIRNIDAYHLNFACVRVIDDCKLLCDREHGVHMRGNERPSLRVSLL